MSKPISHARVLAKKPTFQRLEDVRVLPFAHGNGSIFIIASLESAPNTEKARDVFLEEIILHLETFASHPAPEKDAEPRFEESMQNLNELLKAWLENHQNVIDIPRSGMLIGSLTGSTLVITGFGQVASMYLHAKGDGDEAFDLVRDIRRESAPNPEKLFRTVLMGVLESGDRAIFGNTAALRLLPKDELANFLTTLPVTSAAEHIAQKAEPSNESVIAFIIKAPEKSAASAVTAQTSARVSVEELARAENRTEDVLTRTPQNSKDFAKKTGNWFRAMLSGGSVFFFALLWALLKLMFGAIKFLFALPFGPGHREKAKTNFKQLTADLRVYLGAKLEPISWPMRIVFLLIVIALFASAIATGKSLSQRKLAEIDHVRESKIADVRSLEEDAEAKLIYRDDAGAKNALDAAEKIFIEDPSLQTHEAYPVLSANIVRLRKELRKEYMLAVEPGFTLPSEGLRIGVINKKPFGLTKKGELLVRGAQPIATSLKPTFAWYGGDTVYASDANGAASSIAEDGTVKTLQGVIPNTLSDATMYSGRIYATQPASSSILRMDPITGGFGAARTWQKGAVASLSEARSIIIDIDVYIATPSNILKFTSGNLQPFTLGTIDPVPTDIQKIWTSETSNFLYILEAKNHRVIVVDKGNGAYMKQYLFDGLENVSDFFVDENAKQIWLLNGSQVSLGSM